MGREFRRTAAGSLRKRKPKNQDAEVKLRGAVGFPRGLKPDEKKKKVLRFGILRGKGAPNGRTSGEV